MARIAASLGTLRDQIDRAFPNRNKASDGWIGDSRHQARESDHNPDSRGIVHALDVTHDPVSGCDCGEISEALRQSRDPRIKFLIFNGRICSSTVSPWVWRSYDGDNPHHTHVHVSVNTQGEDDTSPWSIGTQMPLFEEKAPGIMRELIANLDIGTEDAAAILGNIGLESDGFRAHQEYGTSGSQGGIGWCQWTGSRRTDFENWSRQRGLDVRSDEANLGFLLHELTSTSEAKVIPLMKAEYGLYNKVKKFCDVFERPGVNHYDMRLKYAERALEAYEASKPVPAPVPDPVPDVIADGSVTPDDLLGTVRPETVTFRDTITSEIEGFPRGIIETTYVRKSVRFLPEGSISTTTGKGANDMLAQIADFIFNKLLAPADGAKSWIGIAIWVLGIVLGFQSDAAVAPEHAEAIEQLIRLFVEMFGNNVSLVGMTLTAAGLGHKAGKQC